MSSLDAFADLIGHEIEMTRYPGQNGRWSCSIRYAEVMERGMLGGLYGNGKTPEKAMADYARQIAGKRIAINAGTSRRKEYDVPADLVGGDAPEEKNTVRVRVVVAVSPTGQWAAAGGSGENFDPVNCLRETDDCTDEHRLTWITASVPLPEPVAEVEATIEAGNGGAATDTSEGKEREFNER